MITILLPFASAFLYRLEGKNAISKAAWTCAMFLIGIIASFDYATATAFALLCLAERMPPTQSTLCVLTGTKYGREDSKMWRWMQTASETIAIRLRDRSSFDMTVNEMWYIFGGVHGTFRPFLAVIPIAAMVAYTGELIYLTGLFVFTSGLIRYWWGVQQRRFNMSDNYGWVCAERMIGLLLGLILLSWV